MTWANLTPSKGWCLVFHRLWDISLCRIILRFCTRLLILQSLMMSNFNLSVAFLFAKINWALNCYTGSWFNSTTRGSTQLFSHSKICATQVQTLIMRWNRLEASRSTIPSLKGIQHLFVHWLKNLRETQIFLGLIKKAHQKYPLRKQKNY